MRYLDEKPAIKYKRQLWPLINTSEVHLDNVAPADETSKSHAVQHLVLHLVLILSGRIAPRHSLEPPV